MFKEPDMHQILDNLVLVAVGLGCTVKEFEGTGDLVRVEIASVPRSKGRP